MNLDNKTKELIAIGASVSANCQPCLEYHAGKAIECGAEIEEVEQAIEVGKLVRRGAASKMDNFSSELIRKTAPIPAIEDSGCDCNKK
jgi:AhpD family alkylhydroperoxidase